MAEEGCKQVTGLALQVCVCQNCQALYVKQYKHLKNEVLECCVKTEIGLRTTQKQKHLTHLQDNQNKDKRWNKIVIREMPILINIKIL